MNTCTRWQAPTSRDPGSASSSAGRGGITCSEGPTLCHGEPHLQTSTSHAICDPRTRRDRRARHTCCRLDAEGHQHRLASSRQTEHHAARRAALPRASCSSPVSSAAAAQDCYCNLCYCVSQGICHKTRPLTVAIGARATGDGRADQERLLWRRWKLVAHPGRWPPADVDWGPA